MSRNIPRSVQSLSHLDRTNYYEKVVLAAGGSPFLAPYGALVAVTAGSPGTITAPPVTGTEATTKDAFHFGVVSVDGTGFTISGNGKNINGTATVTIAAVAGASAYLYYSNVLGEWIAFLSGGASIPVTPLPSFTGKNVGVVNYTDASPTTTLTTASITAAVGQKVVMTFSAQITNPGDTPVDALWRIFVDTQPGIIDNGAITTIVGGSVVLSWTLEVNGDGAAHTYGLAIQLSGPDSVNTPTLGCRYVAQVVAA